MLKSYLKCVHTLRTGRHKRQADITLLFKYMLKTLYYFMKNGLCKISLLILLISLYFKKIFSREHTKNQTLMFGLVQTAHFGLLDTNSPESQLAFHIYYLKYENTLTCKRISWDSGRGECCFKDSFLFPICIIQKVTILAPK